MISTSKVKKKYVQYEFYFNIGIKHGFSCINIRQVPREVLKTKAETENICYISRYFLRYFVLPFHRCLVKAICTDYARPRAEQYTSCIVLC